MAAACCRRAAALVSVALTFAVASPPPLFNITARTLYDAGLQHGRLAADRIHAWLGSKEMQGVWNFTLHDDVGKAAYKALRYESSTTYPVYARELKGIAEGAKVDLDKLWAAMLMIEMENLMQSRYPDHCSDIFAVAPGGFQEGFAHGHNEDWSVEVGRLYYYVKYTPVGSDADFESCAGLAYPGALIGWAPTWNAHGVFMTVNTLYPKVIRTRGLTTAFVQREAMCGVGRGRGLDQVVAGLRDPRWAEGASVNLVDIRQRRSASVEVHESSNNVLEVTEQMGNYSHFNAYKRLDPDTIQLAQPSSQDRQALADSLPAPHNRNDVVNILSTNTSIDGSTPIFRDITIATLVLDGATSNLDIWCCGRKAADSPPVHSWQLHSFFSEQLAEAVQI